MNVALVVTVVFIVGTLVYVPPFSSVLDFSESIKEAASKKYGEPPWGHAELAPIGTFARKMGWQPEEAIAVLKQAGYEVSGPKETVEEIARSKGVPPQELYLTLKSQLQSPDVAQGALPDTPPAGFGQRSLEEIAAEYRVPLKPMLEALKAKGVDADAATSLKNLGADAGRTPYELFEIIKKAVESAPAVQSPGPNGGQGKNQGKAAADGQQPMGLGRMTLGEVVAQYGLDAQEVQKTLKTMNIEPDMEAKLRPLAESAGLTPLDIYNALTGQPQ